MIAIPDITAIRFNETAGEGQIYVGLAGVDPTTSPESVYLDYAGTNSVATPIRTDANGQPVVDGVVYNALYVDYNYSIQIVDADNVELFSPYKSSDV